MRAPRAAKTVGEVSRVPVNFSARRLNVGERHCDRAE